MEDRGFNLNLALENAEVRHERTVKRFIIAIVVMIVVFFANNVAWLYAWMQYEYVGEEVTVDGSDGIAGYVNGGGTLINGASGSKTESSP